jgi:hypothetical protein
MIVARFSVLERQPGVKTPSFLFREGFATDAVARTTPVPDAPGALSS